ncbi:MAG TPA: potassium-transporting ATPase subunit KdpC [Candidatus Sulfopaludibacter sp.]|jgi:K+-transporting ATPase ATPase C chain|nr:potassium-transporting ATPase subunit KdpC [Candidatus Sulfopaludibacter sp.]
MRQIIIGLKITAVMIVLTGLIYPLLVTALAAALFHHQASGSPVVVNGKIVGSELIGQRFTRPEYFHGRNDGYDPMASGPSNLGPTNQKLIDRVKEDVQRIRAENPTYTGPVPADLVTQSASGLDPEISPASADLQVARVAAARGASEATIRGLVAAHTEGRQFGMLGEPRVNVLKLNLALDRK